MVVVTTAWWTVRCVALLRRQLRRHGLTGVDLPPPPAAPAWARRVVGATLRVTMARCLTRSLVRQAWWRARGVQRDVIVGTRTGGSFAAHAWLDGDPEPRGGFTEVYRHPAAA